MAKDFVKIDTSTTTAIHASALKTSVRQMRDAYDKAIYLKQVMEHMIDGSDYSDVELYFGLPAGQGQAVYNLLAGAVSINTRIFTEQVG